MFPPLGTLSKRTVYPGVAPLVGRNVALAAEAPWAHGASVGFLAGVGPLVRRNIALFEN